jgi:hypothetical protein
MDDGKDSGQTLTDVSHQGAFAWANKAEALSRLGRHQEAFEAGLNIPERLFID